MQLEINIPRQVKLRRTLIRSEGGHQSIIDKIRTAEQVWALCGNEKSISQKGILPWLSLSTELSQLPKQS
jgi:hypothetical protein